MPDLNFSKELRERVEKPQYPLLLLQGQLQDELTRLEGDQTIDNRENEIEFIKESLRELAQRHTEIQTHVQTGDLEAWLRENPTILDFTTRAGARERKFVERMGKIFGVGIDHANQSAIPDTYVDGSRTWKGLLGQEHDQTLQYEMHISTRTAEGSITAQFKIRTIEGVFPAREPLRVPMRTFQHSLGALNQQAELSSISA